MTTSPNNRDDWLAWRRDGVGASDIGGILGLSPWASPYSVWADKMGLTPDGEPSEAMDLGSALEDSISALFLTRTGLYACGAQTRVTHPDRPWARATLDGYAGDHPGAPITAALGVVEAKTTGDSPDWWEQKIPDQYIAQVQWQMYVTGMDRAWIAALHASRGLAFRVYEIERDETDIEYIVAAAEAFWVEHVLTGIPPEADGSTATTWALRHIPATAGAEVELDAEIAELLERHRVLKVDAKATAASLDAVENRIKAAMGEATEGMIGGRLAVSWRPQNRKGLDLGALRETFPDVAAQFETVTTGRVLRPVTDKER